MSKADLFGFRTGTSIAFFQSGDNNRAARCCWRTWGWIRGSSFGLPSVAHTSDDRHRWSCSSCTDEVPVYNNVSMFPFIVNCNYFDWPLNATREDAVNCRDTVQLVCDPLRYRGCSIRPSTNITRKICSLKAIVYLSDFADSRFKYFNADVTLSQSAGVKVSVHAAGSNIRTGVGISPENLVDVSQTRHTRLPVPYGNGNQRINLAAWMWEKSTTFTRSIHVFDFACNRYLSTIITVWMQNIYLIQLNLVSVACCVSCV